LSFIRHTAVKYVDFILATAILDFWRRRRHGIPEVAPLKSLTPKTWG